MKALLSICLILLLASSLPALQFAKWHTSMGDFTCKLYDDLCPITAGNFISLTNSGFYNNLIFHRVVAGFVIQDGDPLGTGYGGPGYTIPDEFIPGLHHDSAGVIAMAHTSAPNSAGSQYYITLAPASHLDGAYAIFGKVIEGLDTVLAIGQVPTNANGLPLTPVNIITLSMIDLDLGILTPPLEGVVPGDTVQPTMFIVEASSISGTHSFAWYVDGTLQSGQSDFIFETSFPTAGAHTVRCTVSQGDFHYNLDWNVQSGSALGDPVNSPAALKLSASPNPFSGELKLSFESSSKEPVRIDIFDLKGRSIRTEQAITPDQGSNSWLWDGKDSSGRKLDNGIYLIKLSSGDQQSFLKATLLN